MSGFRSARQALRDVVLLVVTLLLAVGCADAPPPSGAQRWPCPATWVPAAVGGCGPAVLLCVPDGGAAPGACQGVDITRPPMIALPDGGTVRGFYRLPDGGIGGGWPELGDPEGPPDEAWVPDAGITACAEGWRRLDDGTCDPMLREDCPTGSEALPGGTCTPTSLADCPAGEYADPGIAAMGATVVHVRAGVDATRADGSVAHPYATISEGAARAGSGGWVLVAAGEYEESLVTTASVHVVGVCAARAIMRGPLGGVTIAVSGRGRDVDVRGLTITGAGHGMQTTNAATLRAARVVVVGNFESGIVAGGSGTRVEVMDSVVRGTRARSDGTAGVGLGVQGGATLVAAGVAVVNNADVGIVAIGARTSAVVSMSVVRATRPRRDGSFGRGLQAETGATLRATGVVIVDNVDVGVVANNEGTLVEVARSIVHGTRPRSNGTYGRGLSAQTGATLRASDSLIANNYAQGIVGSDTGTEVEVARSEVRETHPRPDGTSGAGLAVESGATLRAVGVVAAGNSTAAVLAYGEGTQAELVDSILRGTKAPPKGPSGHGLEANMGARVRARGLLVIESIEAGIAVLDPGTEMDLEATVVRDTHPRGDGAVGHGVTVQHGGTLRAARILVTSNTGTGISVGGVGSTVNLTASAVRNTRAHINGRGGMGVTAQRGATLLATNVLMEDNADVGVAIIGLGTQCSLAASSVRGTHADGAGFFGRGLAVQDGATLSASSVLVQDSVEVGLDVRAASLSVVDLLIKGVSPSARGLGVGLYAVQGARVDGRRTAIQATRGSGVATLPFQGAARSQIVIGDLFVRDIALGTIRFNESNHTVSPVGRETAYGLHVVLGCTADLSRALLAQGGFGVFNAGGVVRLQQGVIAGQREGAGATDLTTPLTATAFDAVAFTNNASDTIARRDDLPTASELPALEPVKL